MTKEKTLSEKEFLEKIRKSYFEDLGKVTNSVSMKEYLDEIRMIIDKRLFLLKKERN